jgi:nitrogen fixation protein NifQ
VQPVIDPKRRHIYDHLMALSRGLANDDRFARMLAAHHCGGGSMPRHLGLGPVAYRSLLERHFPQARLPESVPRPNPPWDPRLMEERKQLEKLLLLYRASRDESELWMSVIVATGCMFGNHLWEDLGLWSRQDLSELMASNFPNLAVRNNKDMKWKKFLYKQLCIQEGIYICRAPSCDLCLDYDGCFGPEESPR